MEATSVRDEGKIVLNFLETLTRVKDMGNEAFKIGNYSNAISLYSGALSLCDTSNNEEDTIKLQSILLCNRAACHLKLANFQSCVDDCNAALELTPIMPKALYRRAQGSIELSDGKSALEDLNVLIRIDPHNKEFASLLRKVSTMVEADRKHETSHAVEEAADDNKQSNKSMSKQRQLSRGSKDHESLSSSSSLSSMTDHILYFHVQEDSKNNSKAGKLCERICQRLELHGFRLRMRTGSKAAFEDGDFALFFSKAMVAVSSIKNLGKKGKDYTMRFISRMPFIEQLKLTDDIIEVMLAEKKIVMPPKTRYSPAPKLSEKEKQARAELHEAMSAAGGGGFFSFGGEPQDYGRMIFPLSEKERENLDFCLYLHVIGGIEARNLMVDELELDDFDAKDCSGGQVSFEDGDFPLFVTKVLEAAQKHNVTVRFMARMPYCFGMLINDDMIESLKEDDTIEFPPDTVYHPLKDKKKFDYGTLEFLKMDWSMQQNRFATSVTSLY